MPISRSTGRAPRRGHALAWPRRGGLVALTALGVPLLLAAPAAAHGGGEAAVSAAAGPLRTILVVATCAFAGLVLVAGRCAVRPQLVGAAALLSLLADGAVALGGVAMPGWPTALAVAHAAVVGVTWWAAPRALSAAGALLAAGSLTLLSTRPGVVLAAHAVGAALWLGAVLAAAAAPDRRAALRALRTPVLVASAAVVTTGVVAGWSHGLRLDPGAVVAAVVAGDASWLRTALLEPAFHQVVTAKGAAVVAVLGLAAARRHGRWGEAGCLAAAVALGATLVSAPAPVPAVAAASAAVRTVSLGGTPTGVFVTPGSPGANLVGVGREASVVGGRPVQPGWYEVQLPAGRATVTVTDGRSRASLAVVTGSAPAAVRPDVSCAGRLLGAALAADVPARCPSTTLSAAERAALSALPRLAAARGARTVAVVVDASARSRSAAAAVRERLRHSPVRQVPPAEADALIVTGAALPAAAGHQAVYLAPWLLDDAAVTRVGTAALVPLGFDPHGARATAFLRALRRAAPGIAPTSGMFEGWTGGDTGTSPRLYAATRIAILPASVDPHAGADRGRWLRRHTLTAIS